jgi:enediyne biosynthesis protein E4
MGIKVFDVNGDGKLDIFITDMHSDMSETTGPEHAHMKSDIKWPESFRGNGSTSIWGNSLFIREAPGKFREASQEFNTENYWPWGLTAADFNADGYEDAFITAGMSYPFRYEINSLKLNDGGKRFVDAEFLTGIEPRRYGVAMPWFELDASGADRAHPDAKGLTGRVTVLSSKSSRSSVALDIDGDSDLDLITTEFNAYPMVLVSNLSERTTVRHLTVKLVGTTSNRDGLGAIVTVTAGGRAQTKVNDGNSGYLSHSTMPLYFGLGSAAAADRVDVLWPSGKRQTVQSPPAGRPLEIREN